MWIILAALAVVALPVIAQDSADDADGGEWVSQPGEGQEAAPAPEGEVGEDQPGEANGGEPEGEAPAEEQKGPGGIMEGPWFFVIMIGGFILLYWIMGSSKRKQEAKRREMLSSLSKGDKIITIGGIIGTAVEVRDDEITVKVDDGTRMKFARWAIRTAGDEVKDQKKEDADKK
jgi:preprotein translocase subunit YajC